MSADHITDDYPRDMVGYGANPPHPHWPGDANIAVQFVLNYEEGGGKQRAPWRQGIRDVPVGDHRRPAVRGRAPCEHGVDL